MAIIGLSKPYIAPYTNNGTTVTYGTPALLGKAVNLNLNLNSGSDNVLYADNAPAESDNQFSGGTVGVQTDDLLADVYAAVLGLAEEAVPAGTGIPTGAKWIVFDDDQDTPYLALGGIVKKKVSGAIKYMAVIFDKIQFMNPNLAVATQGATIEWQTPELSGNIMRSDNEKHSWQRHSTLCDSEAEAEAVLLSFFSPAAPAADDSAGE